MLGSQKGSQQKDRNSGNVNTSMDEQGDLEGLNLKQRYKGLGGANIEERMKDSHLSQFGHVQRDIVANQ